MKKNSKEYKELERQMQIKEWVNEWHKRLKARLNEVKIDEFKLDGISKEELALALYFVIDQSCQEDKNGWRESYYSYYAMAISLLYRMGLISEVYKLPFGRYIVFKLKDIEKEEENG